MNLSKYGITELSKRESKNTNGGFIILGALAAIAGIVYLAGEIAYMQGRADAGCDQ